MPDPFARPLPAVQAALAAASTRRQSLLAARDRREQDMVAAFTDVESYERRLVDSAMEIDNLLEERQRAQANSVEAQAIADRLICP